MKITVSKSALIDAINTASRAVSSKTTMPILKCLILSAGSEGFEIFATDMEMNIKVFGIEAEIETAGRVAADASMFGGVIRKMPDGEITISTDDKFILKIKSGKVNFSIAGLDAAEFPVLPAAERDKTVGIAASELKNIIRRTRFSVGTDPGKPVFRGELFEIREGKINVVAVDGYRISHGMGEVAEVCEVMAVVPGKTLQELERVLPEDGEVVMCFSARQVVFEMQGVIFGSQIIQGDFLAYRLNFEADCPISAVVDKASLLSAVERVMLLSHDETKPPVRLAFDENELKLSSRAPLGSVDEEIPVKCAGGSVTIEFNPQYFLDVLRVTEESSLRLNMSSPLSPCVVDNLENDRFRYLILPLRPKS
ncbi:MAG: DNA polymerase III subunit beta [Clostridiales bacterium]|jgi:DNA polymerase-3 subunit beta|nr:DNA polymerase III subunit beta [Clostridiales bacterium]